MDNAEQTVNVVIYERSPKLAIGIARLLEKSRIIQVVGRTEQPQRLKETVASLRPHVVVIGADRPGFNLVEVCREMSQYSVGVVLFSTESQRGPVREAMDAGAHSLLSWPFHPRDMILAVVHAGCKFHRINNLSILSEVEQQMKADDELSTGALKPLLEWASTPVEGVISPRLLKTAALSDGDQMSMVDDQPHVRT